LLLFFNLRASQQSEHPADLFITSALVLGNQEAQRRLSFFGVVKFDFGPLFLECESLFPGVADFNEMLKGLSGPSNKSK
jgi:hypothetical protein